MSKSNGHRNGEGGNGGTTLSDLSTRRHKRETMLFIQSAVKHGWQVPDRLKTSLPTMLEDIATNAENERDRMRAIECLRAMVRDNLEAAVILDKLERLDGGEATENNRIEIVYQTPARITDDD